jgi:hypothetical protein
MVTNVSAAETVVEAVTPLNKAADSNTLKKLNFFIIFSLVFLYI